MVYSDFKHRVVLNTQVFLALILVISTHFAGFVLNLKAGIVFFLISYLLWRFHIFGGGDAKLISVLALGVKSVDLPFFILLTSVLGFFTCVAVLLAKSRRGVPYAPSIFLAYLVIFYFYKG